MLHDKFHVILRNGYASSGEWLVMIIFQVPSFCFSCREIQASVAVSSKAATTSIWSAVAAASRFATQSGESTVFEPREGVYLERYWIELRDQ